MKILITGGLGYLGGRLGEHLAQNPAYEVYLGSRFDRSRPRWLRVDNIIKMDWSDSRSLMSACKTMDVIIHASGMNASECLANPKLALELTATIQKNFLKLLKKAKFQSLFLFQLHMFTVI